MDKETSDDLEGQTRIELDDVTKVYTSATTREEIVAVEDFSLEVEHNEFVTLVGPSGCGKSTILNLVAGFLAPTMGKVLYDGEPVEEPGEERGVIFQDYAIFPFLTVQANIEFGLKLRANRCSKEERKEIARDYISLMGLEGFEDSYPKELSGGMKQRVAIARAYAVDPQVFLMDEPFGALDAQTRSKMQSQLLEVLEEQKKTVLFVTHSVEEAIFLSDRVVVITQRPARIREMVDIPFSFPRKDALKTEEEFLDLREKVKEEVMQEYAKQEEARSR